MSPRVILYIGLAISLFPLFGMWQYVSVIMSVPPEAHDPDVLRELTERMAMLGMFSWPIWLGLAGFSVLRWHYLMIFERFVAWLPMLLFSSCYVLVLGR